MLNGRVYGGPKRDPNANPFANARDEEPEFVEWGYGGMGSVKGAKSAGVSGTNWDRLHGNGSVNGSKQQGSGAQETEDENGDDGSGMGWVKKRREKREREERERREKEEREKLEQEKGPKATDDVVPGSDELGSRPTTSVTPIDHDHTEVVPAIATLELSILVSDPATSTHEPSVPRPTTPASTSTATDVIHPLSSPSTSPSVEKEYIHETISIPTRNYHHHRRSASRDTIPLSLSSGTSVTSPKVIEEIHNSSSSVSESESESDSEDIGEEDADAEDDDEEEDDELEKRRKTAFSAGVEKVSRFKDLTLFDEVLVSEDLNRA